MNFEEILYKTLTYNPNEPLLFTQLVFWIFFAVLLLGYSLLYKSNRLRNIYLFVFSLFLYYKSGGFFFSLLLFSTVSDYLFGLGIGKYKNKLPRLILVTCSIVVNLGMLAYFKYSYFVTENINNIFNTNFEVINHLAVVTNNIFGSGFNISQIILPVGISFFTFQTISYSVDVYRNKLNPVKNILDFGFYVSFFPQLVAGPIVRAAEFIPQLYRQYKLTYNEFSYALFLIMNGLVKKMVISDYISINFVDRVFAQPELYSGFENLMAVYGYSIQIYCDFSGYTDIAIGTALLLGFRLPVNFNSPYKATNITDFWRRWHISLSTWLRDYLYIPLGGNRNGKIRQSINLMITMLLGGLWHGAHFKFIIWGGIHGLALGVDKIKNYYFPSKSKKNKLFHFFNVFFTFQTVCLAWVFFRADNMDAVNIMLDKIFYGWDISLLPQMIIAYKEVFLIMLVAYVIHWLPANFKEIYRGWFIKTSIVLKVLIIVVIIFIIYQFHSAEVQPFIYFQF